MTWVAWCSRCSLASRCHCRGCRRACSWVCGLLTWRHSHSDNRCKRCNATTRPVQDVWACIAASNAARWKCGEWRGWLSRAVSRGGEVISATTRNGMRPAGVQEAVGRGEVQGRGSRGVCSGARWSCRAVVEQCCKRRCQSKSQCAARRRFRARCCVRVEETRSEKAGRRGQCGAVGAVALVELPSWLAFEGPCLPQQSRGR